MSLGRSRMNRRWGPRTFMGSRDRRLRNATSLAVLVAAALVVWPARSDACECPSQTAWLAWPKASSVDVPVDVTLAVLTSASADLQYVLHDAAGVEVPVTLVRV